MALPQDLSQFQANQAAIALLEVYEDVCANPVGSERIHREEIERMCPWIADKCGAPPEKEG